MHLVIFGGGGKVARHVARLRGSNQVTSVVRNDTHIDDLRALGATPAVLSLEASSAEDIRYLLAERYADAVLFAAGAGGKEGIERTRKVDYEGALKVFEGCKLAGVKRFIMISAVDVRDRSKPAPGHYTAESHSMSKRMWGAIGTYMQAKYDADKALHATELEYTILRPGGLTDEPAGGAEVGVTQLKTTSRELVAKACWDVLAQPGSAGLTLDIMDGDGDLSAEIAKCVENRTDAWTG
ncbi:hypothetical protein CcaverHIS002_0111930 [Cutaneotrichosporon cavernicola]|uniref:NAD(P)-binding domain-containing protein n=1 Tax=Cutaneotrichosporon cavernicola TaxID=279322 RepID=A0AA48HZL2_9TREE|nr:uncharacterized protein CcaverHIS019_0111820 [Cutaneotrichosporon cavernicola]BEI80664.1 hypothetical protein CcaverHIS002_0111930 [Cutaneotrichosporon cavernicola]BEI88464.1 hypothetical protein CcaverHIS019_0111820 [Cutaneotrichosporon cavernicola]BEI96237.1 hypothetical protein CcaverHIS631_0111860 [Cutaneotrichosporon cavernicola]BEJ04008.1 hypothetical protein CcaverHIS641_0111830 [Cutaneotrichosporon cavernicola]